jgi:outer membrane lipoprotein-sorting protein
MKCKWIALLLFATTLLPIQVSAQGGSTGNKMFDTLRARFASGELFHSQLNHSFIDSYTGDTLTTLGEVWIDKGRYKLSMRSGLVIVDGNTSHVYNSEKNQVIISPYNPDEDDYAPSRFLHGSLKEYSIKNGANNGRNSVVVMTSDDPFALFTVIDIELDEKALPIRITAVDQSGNVIISRFSFGTFLKQDAQVFTLSYPKSAEIIDLRN